MNRPTVNARRNVATDVDQLGTYIQVPDAHFAVNAFLLRSREPVLVDAGIVTMKEEMLAALSSLIDPSELRWIYLSHVDGDHVGCIEALLESAPKARIVTTFLGWSKLGFARTIAPNRFHLVNAGQELDVGDRKLLIARPPCYDAPETTMLFDPTSRTLFSSDYLGALVPSPVEVAEQVPASALREGMMTWLSVDSPWVRTVQPALLEQATRAVLELRPETVLGAHLAPAYGMAKVLSENVLHAPGAAPWIGPDQAAFEKMLESMG